MKLNKIILIFCIIILFNYYDKKIEKFSEITFEDCTIDRKSGRTFKINENTFCFPNDAIGAYTLNAKSDSSVAYKPGCIAYGNFYDSSSNRCLIDGWDDWSDWSECSDSCRNRIDAELQSEKCKKTRTRACKTTKNDCVGNSEETSYCPRDGSYTDWSDWSNCSAKCGLGKQKQTRTCDTKHKYGGDKCIFETEKSQPCNPTNCCNEYLSGKGEKYRGCQTSTKDGNQCINWKDSNEYEKYKSDLDNEGNHSYCRNPNGEKDRIWCYTNKEGNKWSFCKPINEQYQNGFSFQNFKPFCADIDETHENWKKYNCSVFEKKTLCAEIDDTHKNWNKFECSKFDKSELCAEIDKDKNDNNIKYGNQGIQRNNIRTYNNKKNWDKFKCSEFETSELCEKIDEKHENWRKFDCDNQSVSETKPEEKKKEYKLCNETLTGNGSDYKGCQNKIYGGQECLKWSDVIITDTEKTKFKSIFDEENGNHNYCRNPNNSTYGIWCYTDTDKTKGQCNPLPLEVISDEADLLPFYCNESKSCHPDCYDASGNINNLCDEQKCNYNDKKIIIEDHIKKGFLPNDEDDFVKKDYFDFNQCDYYRTKFLGIDSDKKDAGENCFMNWHCKNNKCIVKPEDSYNEYQKELLKKNPEKYKGFIKYCEPDKEIPKTKKTGKTVKLREACEKDVDTCEMGFCDNSDDVGGDGGPNGFCNCNEDQKMEMDKNNKWFCKSTEPEQTAPEQTAPKKDMYSLCSSDDECISGYCDATCGCKVGFDVGLDESFTKFICKKSTERFTQVEPFTDETFCKTDISNSKLNEKKITIKDKNNKKYEVCYPHDAQDGYTLEVRQHNAECSPNCKSCGYDMKYKSTSTFKDEIDTTEVCKYYESMIKTKIVEGAMKDNNCSSTKKKIVTKYKTTFKPNKCLSCNPRYIHKPLKESGEGKCIKIGIPEVRSKIKNVELEEGGKIKVTYEKGTDTGSWIGIYENFSNDLNKINTGISIYWKNLNNSNELLFDTDDLQSDKEYRIFLLNDNGNKEWNDKFGYVRLDGREIRLNENKADISVNMIDKENLD